MKMTTMENVNSIEAICSTADVRLLDESEVTAVSGGLAVMTQPIKWYHVGDGLFLGFNQTTGLWAGWGHLK